jgi:hypothetical protein
LFAPGGGGGVVSGRGPGDVSIGGAGLGGPGLGDVSIGFGDVSIGVVGTGCGVFGPAGVSEPDMASATTGVPTARAAAAMPAMSNLRLRIQTSLDAVAPPRIGGALR